MNILYRKCSEKEILSLLKDRMLFPKDKQFLSFSEVIQKKSGTQGKKDTLYVVEYDYDIILKQGGIKVEYNIDWFKKHPDIALHVSGANDIEFFINNTIDIKFSNYEGTFIEKAYDYMSTWRAKEKEVVLSKLVFESGLIKNIYRIDNLKVSDKITNQLIFMNKISLNQSQGMFAPIKNGAHYIGDIGKTYLKEDESIFIQN